MFDGFCLLLVFPEHPAEEVRIGMKGTGLRVGRALVKAAKTAGT